MATEQKLPRNKTTLDSEGRVHSFNDEPAKVEGKSKTWYKHGIVHHDNDKPAFIFIEGEVGECSTWFVNGEPGRENDKPTYLSGSFGDMNGIQTWTTGGLYHRVVGHTVFHPYQNISQWYLYDLQLTQEQHQKIVLQATSLSCPLWVSFLIFLKVISDEELAFLSGITNKWFITLPVSWVFASLNITAEKLDNAYHNPEIPEAYKFAQKDTEEDLLNTFIKVALLES